MKEVKVSDEEIQRWLKGPSQTNVLMPLPLPWTRSELIRQLASQPFGNMGGSAATRKAKPKASRKQWTAFQWKHFDIAIRTDGTVAVKGWQHRPFTLWIRPNGEAGTTADNKLEMDQLGNETFADALLNIKEQIDAWAARVKGRKVPQGPSLLLQRSLHAVMKRREDNRKGATHDRGFFKTPTREWPFSD